MPRIAENLELMKGWAVEVCTKAGIERSAGHKKRDLCEFSNNCLEIENS